MSDLNTVLVYDLFRDRCAFYHDAYYGGFHWRNPSAAILSSAEIVVRVVNQNDGSVTTETQGFVRTYLVPFEGESKASLLKRHNLSPYYNICQPLVDSYTSAVTARVIRNLTTFDKLLDNVNGRGRSWQGHIKEVAKWSAVYGFVATVQDTVSSEQSVEVGARICVVSPASIAWCLVDKYGEITEFCYVEETYISPIATGNTQKIQVVIYTKTEWIRAVFESEIGKGIAVQRQMFLEKGEVLERGTLPIPGKVPVEFCFYNEVTSTKYPLGVSLISDTSDVARNVYNTLSSSEDIYRKTAFPFLAIPQKSTDGSLSPQTKAQVGPSEGLGYPSDTGAPQWVQPGSEQTSELRAHVLFQISMAFRLAGIEISVENTSGIESGLAIQLKSRGFEQCAATFANEVADYEQRVLNYYKTVFDLRDDFTVSYPKRFVLADASEDLARAVLLLQTLANELGTEGKIEAAKQAINAALTLSQDRLEEIITEVRNNLTPKTPVILPTQENPVNNGSL